MIVTVSALTRIASFERLVAVSPRFKVLDTSSVARSCTQDLMTCHRDKNNLMEETYQVAADLEKTHNHMRREHHDLADSE